MYKSIAVVALFALVAAVYGGIIAPVVAPVPLLGKAVVAPGLLHHGIGYGYGHLGYGLGYGHLGYGLHGGIVAPGLLGAGIIG